MKDPNGKRRRWTVLTNLQQWQNHCLKSLRNDWKRGGGRNRGTLRDWHLRAGLAFAFLQNVSYNLVVWAVELIILSCTCCFPFAPNGSGRPIPKSTFLKTVLYCGLSRSAAWKNYSHIIKAYIHWFAFPSALLPVSGGVQTTALLQPTQDSTGAHHSQHLQWDWSKAWGEEQGWQWDPSHLGLSSQSMTVVIKAQKKGIALKLVQIQVSLLWCAPHISVC